MGLLHSSLLDKLAVAAASFPSSRLRSFFPDGLLYAPALIGSAYLVTLKLTPRCAGFLTF